MPASITGEAGTANTAQVGVLLAVNNEGSFLNTHSHGITLQTLNARHPHPAYPDGLYYSVGNFAGTEKAWESSDLVVFAPPGRKVEHLNHENFTRDPLGEVNRLGYRIAGRLNNTRIVTEDGKPRVNSEIAFTDDEARKFSEKKRLGLSDAFDAVIAPDGTITGPVVPNHVLLFLKCAAKSDGFCGIPNDPGAGFVDNLSEDTMGENDEIKGLTQSVKDLIGLHKENPLQKTVDNVTAEVQKRDVQIDALTKENAGLKADKQKVDNVLAEQAKEKKDSQWAQVKNLYKPALFHKPEDEAARRAEFEADPVAFQLANVGNLAPAGEKKKAEGKEAVGNLEGDDEGKPFDMVAARGKFDVKTGTFTGGQ